jgi:hypothetical protein
MHKYIHKNTSEQCGGEFKAEFDRRYVEYKNSTAKLITTEESKRRIKDFLKPYSR